MLLTADFLPPESSGFCLKIDAVDGRCNSLSISSCLKINDSLLRVCEVAISLDFYGLILGLFMSFELFF